MLGRLLKDLFVPKVRCGRAHCLRSRGRRVQGRQLSCRRRAFCAHVACRTRTPFMHITTRAGSNCGRGATARRLEHSSVPASRPAEGRVPLRRGRGAPELGATEAARQCSENSARTRTWARARIWPFLASLNLSRPTISRSSLMFHSHLRPPHLFGDRRRDRPIDSRSPGGKRA